MKHLVLVALIALAGCSVDNASTTQHDSTVPQEGTDEVTLNPSQKMYVTFGDIDRIYQETMACLGLYAEGPTIAFVDFPEFFAYPEGSTGTGGWGVYDPTGSYAKVLGDVYYGVEQELIPNVVLINTHDTIVGVERDARTDEEVLRHEFIHHILNVNYLDWHHTNPLFAQCGVGVNTYN